MNVAKRRVILMVTLLAIAGCDGATRQPATRPTTRRADAPVPTHVAMTTLATLPASRVTQLAAMANGDVYALQQSDAPAAVVRVADGRETSLTSAAIVRALGVANGAGQILAIAARDDGKLAFAFVGDAPRPTISGETAPTGSLRLAAIGTWDPTSGAIVVGVDQLALAHVDAAFADAATLRPTLIVNGDDVWLWRTLDELTTMRRLTVRGLSTLHAALVSQDVAIAAAGDAVERRAWEWSATDDDGRFLLTDTASRWIRSLDTRGPMATTAHVARFADPNVASISPAALDAAGRVIVLARDGDGAVRSLLVQDGDAFRAIDASRFTLDGKPLDGAIRIDRLVAMPKRFGEFVAYDAASGRVLRVTVS